MNEFLEQVPEDIRENEHLAKFENVGDLATDYVNRINKPYGDLEHEALKDVDPSQLAQKYIDIHDKVPEAPKSVDEYTAEFPSDYTPDEADLTLFKETALKNGLTQAQFKAVVDHDVARMNRIAKVLADNQKEAMDTLKGDWKDKFDSKVELATKVLKSFGGEELAKRVDVGDDPGMLKFLVSIGEKISEDLLVSGTPPPPGKKLREQDDGTHTLSYPSMQE